MGWISGSARRVSHRTAQAKTWSLVGAVESSLLVVAQRVKPVSQVSGVAKEADLHCKCQVMGRLAVQVMFS